MRAAISGESRIGRHHGPTSPIGVGLVGAGEFGRRLALATRASPDLRIVALHDADPARAAAASVDLDIRVVPGLAQLLKDPQVEAVIVATPHATHLSIALAAAAEGRHLFVEKPLAISVADGKAMIDAAHKARVALLVGHVTRLLPVVVQALDLLDAGRIGEPMAAWMLRHQRLSRPGWFARRSDFGMLLHSPAIHNLDLLNRILGRAASVSALASPNVQADVEYPDVVAALIGYQNDRVGWIGATISDPLFSPSGTSSARIVGSKGGMAFDVATGRIEVQATDAPLERIVIEAADWGLEGALEAELANFVAVIRGEADPFVTPEEALRAVELCEAADRSIRTRDTVRLPLESDG